MNKAFKVKVTNDICKIVEMVSLTKVKVQFNDNSTSVLNISDLEEITKTKEQIAREIIMNLDRMARNYDNDYGLPIGVDKLTDSILISLSSLYTENEVEDMCRKSMNNGVENESYFEHENHRTGKNPFQLTDFDEWFKENKK